jgi:hypothetical protein
MAKPKSPNSKKSNDLKPTVSTTSTPSPLPTNGSTAAEATAPAMETSIETAAAATKNPTPMKTETRKTARKPEIVKGEARTNLVPISLEEEIRQLAYLLSERRGFKSGHETEDWLAAENEVRQRYRQHSA